ncbi:hypothetical protein GNF10_29340 [Nostoc sp. UCD121]|nr:hypothetical protein [Nostoc sp. UCD121]MBC1219065.1 hypothetical protein [Nostoc sp. UCD120]MBC1279943.1 hypothetical protein [Nostoc sp. UCD121]MBC1298608.1 hypothetical protein [Nostoc sp. UCD122]
MDDLKNLLNRASFEERKALAEILKASQPTADSIVDRLCEKSQDPASYVFNEIFDDHPSYQKTVRRAAKKLKIKCSKYESASGMEVKIAQKVMERNNVGENDTRTKARNGKAVTKNSITI